MSVDALVSSLAASLEAGVPSFVLVDPLLGEPAPVEYADVIEAEALVQAREQTWRRPVYIVKLSPDIDLPLHQHPYLVELHGPGDPRLAETMEMAAEELNQSQSDGLASSGSAPHRIGGWLQSSLAAPKLTQSLSDMMRVNTQAITTARYQRLADRRAFGLLRQLVGDERVARQLGRIQSWAYLDPCGNLSRLRSPEEAVTPLRLSQREWAVFMRGELLHPTLARWLGQRALRAASGSASAPDARMCYTQANAALERAQAAALRWPRRFTRPSDRVAWAALTLLYPDIDQRAEVVNLLDDPVVANELLETLDDLSSTLSLICEKVSP
jgi:hypothetical protein